ncbi:MAG: hypothetical protein WAL04_06120, partial [Acidimicrobiales bacterium]
MARSQASAPPVIVVVGLGPAGTDMMTAGALEVVAEASSSGVPVFFRTGRHPSAAQLLAAATGAPPPQT